MPITPSSHCKISSFLSKHVSNLGIVKYFSLLKQGCSTDLVLHIQVEKLVRDRLAIVEIGAEELEISQRLVPSLCQAQNLLDPTSLNAG